jgi:hypothetical protein
MVPHALSSAGAVVPAPDTSSVPEEVVPAAASATQTWQPKNTLVRGVLREVTQHTALQQAAAAAAAAAAAQANAAGGTGALQVATQVAEVVEAAAGTPGGPALQRTASMGPHSSHFAVGAGAESSQGPGVFTLSGSVSGRVGGAMISEALPPPSSQGTNTAITSTVQVVTRPLHIPLPGHGTAKSARAPPMQQKHPAATPRTARKPRQTMD